MSYLSGYIYGYEDQKQQQIQLNRQNQKLQIHYDMLGKVLHSAENFAMIANKKKNKKHFTYYDSFGNADTKSENQARTEFISSMEFLQCALNRYKKNNNNFVLPTDINVLEKIEEWKNYFPMNKQKDRKLFEDFKKIIKGEIIGDYDAGNYEAGTGEREYFVLAYWWFNEYTKV